jgi:hypothetical protein
MLRSPDHPMDRPTERSAMTIEQFRMERYQSLYWHEVDYDLSESACRR